MICFEASARKPLKMHPPLHTKDNIGKLCDISIVEGGFANLLRMRRSHECTRRVPCPWISIQGSRRMQFPEDGSQQVSPCRATANHCEKPKEGAGTEGEEGEVMEGG